MHFFNYYNLSLLIGSIVALASGLIVYFRNRKKLLNKTWLTVTISSFFWSIGYFGMITTEVKNIAWYSNWILHAAAIIIPISYLWFILVLTANLQKFKKFLFSSIGIGFIFFIFNPTRIFVQDVKPKYIFDFVCDAGPMYIFFTIYFFVLVLFSLCVLYKKIQNVTGITYQQLKLVFISSVFGFVGGGSVFLLTFNINIPPYPIILFSLYPIVIAYAIIKYRFMDVKMVIFRSILFAISILSIVSIYTILSSILGVYFETLTGGESSLFIGFVISFMVTIGYLPLRNFVERFTNSFLFKKSYSQDQILSKISESTSSILNIHELLISLSSIVSDALHFEKIAFALLDKKDILFLAYQNGFDENIIEKFAHGKEKVLSKYFSNGHDVQVIDELKAKYEAGEYIPKSIELLNDLYNLDIALVIPLYVKERLIGIIVVGNKKSGDPYSHQDLNILKIISGQAAIAIENASLYDELKDYNLKLDEEVKKKTSELRKANDELKQLDEAKSEFISIASHQLRTPLTIIKGYISMMQEGSFGKVSPIINTNLTKVYQANERLIELVENLLDISRIESGRQEFIMQKTHLEDMAQTVVENLKNNAKDKNLKLIFHKPTHKTPEVMADANKLHEVMMNFVDNSIKYTKEGKVEVFVTADENKMVTFCVKDTGMGIKPEIMPVLFRKFSRGKGSFRVHTEGLGLGLYVARMMIDAHKGKIWAESDGDNKGSKFCFSLPAAK